ncbi:hypothetical protein GGR57DRAFT_517219 [Xylariaceae sp. FL1272]|nr:hypothetical protein GGR57DRAFT_517219 [Xylariaceae sp. FL1272]
MTSTTERLFALSKLRLPSANGRSDTEEDVHPWRVLDFEPMPAPLLRISIPTSGSQPNENGNMLARAPHMRLDSHESRKIALTSHYNPSNQEPTPFITFTYSVAAIEEMAQRYATEGLGDITLTVIDPNVRLRKGLPLLSLRNEMRQYGYDSYFKDHARYRPEEPNNDYLALWKVMNDEIVGHWKWSDLRGESDQWYNDIIFPTFMEFGKRAKHDMMGEWLDTHFIYINHYQKLASTYNHIRVVASLEAQSAYIFVPTARGLLRKEWWAQSKALLQTPQAFLTKASRENPPPENTLKSWVFAAAAMVVRMNHMINYHEELIEFLWDRLFEEGYTITSWALMRHYKKLPANQDLKLLSGIKEQLLSDLKPQPTALGQLMSGAKRFYMQSKFLVGHIGSTISNFAYDSIDIMYIRPYQHIGSTPARSNSESSSAVFMGSYEMDDFSDRHK